MGALKQKLKSERGASILLALLFFLVCVMAGSSVLVSAFSNAGRLSHIRDEQAAYLSASSAAKLLREELEGLSFRGVHEEVNGFEIPPDDFGLDSASTSLSALVEGMANGIYSDSSISPEIFSIVPDTGITDLKEAEVTLTMSEDSADEYSLHAEIYLSSRDRWYAMTLDIPATVKISVNTRTETYTETNSDGVEEIKTKEYKTTITTIVFGKGTIAKAKEDTP